MQETYWQTGAPEGKNRGGFFQVWSVFVFVSLVCFLILFLMYVSMLSLSSDTPEECMDPVTDGCEPLCGCWDLNSGRAVGAQPLSHLSRPPLHGFLTKSSFYIPNCVLDPKQRGLNITAPEVGRSLQLPTCLLLVTIVLAACSNHFPGQVFGKHLLKHPQKRQVLLHLKIKIFDRELPTQLHVLVPCLSVHWLLF